MFGKTKSNCQKNASYETMVICKNCDEKETAVLFVPEKAIKCYPTGYKGRVCFYTVCPNCGYKIIISPEDLRRKIVRKLIRKYNCIF